MPEVGLHCFLCLFVFLVILVVFIKKGPFNILMFLKIRPLDGAGAFSILNLNFFPLSRRISRAQVPNPGIPPVLYSVLFFFPLKHLFQLRKNCLFLDLCRTRSTPGPRLCSSRLLMLGLTVSCIPLLVVS